MRGWLYKNDIMTSKQICSIFKIDDLRLLPEVILPIVLSNSKERDALYRQLIEMNAHDLSYDWFRSIYEEEFSERKEKKQDFTPNSVGILSSALTAMKDGSTYEPTAGNGSMIISDWWRKASSHLPFNFYPSRNPVECWELSDRSIPILLLNLSIRGIVGVVHHGDVLEQAEKATYRLINEKDDCLGFSKVFAL